MKRANVLPAPRVDRPLPGESKWDNERQAFLRLRRSLLRSHLGKYVAIHQCKLVDSDTDQIALALRVYARFGYVPIYVGQVLAEPSPPVRIPSPRLLRSVPGCWVTRYRYNQQVNPPAPFVHVTLQRAVGDEAISDLPAQLDTAADLTVVLLRLIEELELVPLDATPVLGFGGILVDVPTFLVRMSLRGGDPVTLKVLGSRHEPHILLGRDMLNRHRFLLDGPGLVLEMDWGSPRLGQISASPYINNPEGFRDKLELREGLASGLREYNSDKSRAGCIYVLNDEEIGLFSDEVVVNYAP